MAHAVRKSSGAVRLRGGGGPLRRWIAIALVVLSCASAAWLLGRDTGWESRRRAYRLKGLADVNNGRFATAGRHFESALAANPYDWETHLSLADLLNHHLNNPDGALRHYLLALAYSPEPALAGEVTRKIDTLRLIRNGELENPADALEDMFLAVEAEAAGAFKRRLSPELHGNIEDYWRAWTRRGRGTVTYMDITVDRDGLFDAILEMDFPDETSMSMHFRCPPRDIWRLELSFP